MIRQPNSAVLTSSQPHELEYYVSEIFYSLQGEGTRSGMPCVFVRLQGCSLRCKWCDTVYGLDHKKGGVTMMGSEIIDAVKSYDCSFVEFTGGEPLEQDNVYSLMSWFCDQNYTVAIETGGHISTEFVDKRVITILDMKAPASKMTPLNKYDNLLRLQQHDEVKFVLSDRADYQWAVALVSEYTLSTRCNAVLFSCVFGSLQFVDLATWILNDKVPVRMQIQMHKMIWDPTMRGV